MLNSCSEGKTADTGATAKPAKYRSNNSEKRDLILNFMTVNYRTGADDFSTLYGPDKVEPLPPRSYFDLLKTGGSDPGRKNLRRTDCALNTPVSRVPRNQQDAARPKYAVKLAQVGIDVRQKFNRFETAHDIEGHIREWQGIRHAFNEGSPSPETLEFFSGPTQHSGGDVDPDNAAGKTLRIKKGKRKSAGPGRNVEYKDFRSIDPGADQPFNEGRREETNVILLDLLLVSVICCGPTVIQPTVNASPQTNALEEEDFTVQPDRNKTDTYDNQAAE
jgi:hypothetical protein